MEMTAVCLGKLAKTASFPHSHSFGDDLEFPFSPSSFNFNFNEKCYLHARYLLLPTCPFAQQASGFSQPVQAHAHFKTSSGAGGLGLLDTVNIQISLSANNLS